MLDSLEFYAAELRLSDSRWMNLDPTNSIYLDTFELCWASVYGHRSPGFLFSTNGIAAITHGLSYHLDRDDSIYVDLRCDIAEDAPAGTFGLELFRVSGYSRDAEANWPRAEYFADSNQLTERAVITIK